MRGLKRSLKNSLNVGSKVYWKAISGSTPDSILGQPCAPVSIDIDEGSCLGTVSSQPLTVPINYNCRTLIVKGAAGDGDAALVFIWDNDVNPWFAAALRKQHDGRENRQMLEHLYLRPWGETLPTIDRGPNGHWIIRLGCNNHVKRRELRSFREGNSVWS